MNPQASFQHAKYCAYADFCTREHTRTSTGLKKRCYCTFVPPLLLLMIHHEKTRLKALPLALTLTLGGTKVQIAPKL